MNLVRSIFSFFLCAIVAVAIAGWIWAGSLPSPKLEASRTMLAICGVASLGCLGALWSARTVPQ
ncbi:MAG: hypothetical protein ACTHOU_03095 [Aureliella sp.]